MSRAQRLLDLVQLLRERRFPVSGAQLASDLGISLRTLYRDIATLQAQGANIEGEAGFGYVLRSGFLLPPLMFSEEEVEALVLGARWVMQRKDQVLSNAAQSALAKIAAVLTDELRLLLETSTLLVGPSGKLEAEGAIQASLRAAIKSEHRVEIDYCDLNEQSTRRQIWPFAIGYFAETCLVVAWCELRKDFRHFRLERVRSLTVLDKRYPKRRAALLKEWRVRENIQHQ